MKRLLSVLFILLTFLKMAATAQQLPLNKTFIGAPRYQAIMQKGVTQNWRTLQIGDRMAKIALELKGVPYKSHTLEIDNHIEAPSANLNGLDCWTFFEVTLCMARLLETDKKAFTEQDLLNEIKWTRYRDGVCTGNYLQRIHYLEEWYRDNDKRRNVVDITRQFPTQRMTNICQEMSILWKNYRYLKHNPELRKGMAQMEAHLTKQAVYMVPKHKVASIESQIQNGDIIGIATKHDGAFCSHVGIAIKDAQGRTRLMHASTTTDNVTIDTTISKYLNQFDKHAGILIARPLPRRR